MSTRPPFTTAVYQSLADGTISSLLKALEKASQQLWPGPLWRTSCLLGLAQELFDIGFRLAQLRRRLPLDARDQLRLAKIGLRLKAWHFSELGSPPIGLKLTATLFHLACSLFFRKLTHPSLQAESPLVRAIMQKVIEVTAQIPTAQLAAPVMAWPVLILAFGAWADPEKKALRSPFEYQESQYGMGNATKALGLMEFIWSLDGSNGGVATLDGLISDEYLLLIPS
jgi:Fungal specific transcription factor domain